MWRLCLCYDISCMYEHVHTVCTVLYVHTDFIGWILCNYSVLNAVEEVIHRCILSWYGDVLVWGCTSSSIYIFACILLQVDEGCDDKFKARRVSCCTFASVHACYCTLMVALFLSMFTF